MRVSIYDHKTKRGTLEFYLAAFVDDKVVALKHIDFSFMPDLKKEDVVEELKPFIEIFKEELSQTLAGEPEDDASVGLEKRRRRSRQDR